MLLNYTGHLVRNSNKSMTMLKCVIVLLCLLVINPLHALEVGENYAIRPQDQEWLTSLFYIPTSPRVRKEYRMLSDTERENFHGAILKMKDDRVSSVINESDVVVDINIHYYTLCCF